MKYNIYNISESFGLDKKAITTYQESLNDILNTYSKKYNKYFNIRFNDYEIRYVLYCDIFQVCGLDMNEHFTEHILIKELNHFCEWHLKEDPEIIS